MFSVIIPTRDRPQYLLEAVQSVLRQTLPGNEIIVVNDGEGPLPALDGLPVRVLDNQQRGPVAARILGVASAIRENIAFLDDDDQWIDEGHLSTAAERLASDAHFCFADGVLTFEPDDQGRKPASFPYSHGADRHTLAADNTILISAVCYRRALHDQLGPFDMALPYYWDWDWYLRVARAGFALAHIERPAVSIRVHQENMSGAAMADARQANLEALARKHEMKLPALKNHLSLALERLETS